MQVATDAEVVRRVLAGDNGAYALLVQRHQRAVIASAHHLTGDREAALDLAQESFIDAWRHLPQLRDHARFAAWLVGILRNKCRGFLSRRAPQEVPLDDAPVPATTDPEPEDGPLLSLLGQLPLTDREVLAARHIHGLSYSEIASALDMSVGSVRTRCCRARGRLRELLSQRANQVEAAGEHS